MCVRNTHDLGCVPMLFRSAFRKADMFDASLNLPMVSCVLVLRTGENVHVHTLIIETLHVLKNLGSADIAIVPVILDAFGFDYGPPKHSSSSCLPAFAADHPHVLQWVTYICK